MATLRATRSGPATARSRSATGASTRSPSPAPTTPTPRPRSPAGTSRATGSGSRGSSTTGFGRCCSTSITGRRARWTGPHGLRRTEGADANKVAAAIPSRARRVAERIAGPLGVGLPPGKPRLYLCHALCELGAEPLGRELRTMAAFLESDPGTFLVLIMEDYVPADRIAGAFRTAGLVQLAATLPRHAQQRVRIPSAASLQTGVRWAPVSFGRPLFSHRFPGMTGSGRLPPGH